MAIEIQQRGELVFLSFASERTMFTTTLTLLEARNLRDALTDMRLIPSKMYDAVIKDGGNPEADFAPLPKNFEEIALADASRRSEKSDQSVRDFYFKKKEDEIQIVDLSNVFPDKEQSS